LFKDDEFPTTHEKNFNLSGVGAIYFSKVKLTLSQMYTKQHRRREEHQAHGMSQEFCKGIYVNL
jgi:hypothetical protein